MNKEQILKKAKQYEKADKLNDIGDRILELDPKKHLVTQSLYHVSLLSKEGRKKVAKIFKEEAETLEDFNLR